MAIVAAALFMAMASVMAFGPIYNSTNSSAIMYLNGTNSTLYIGPIYSNYSATNTVVPLHLGSTNSTNATNPLTLGHTATFILFNSTTVAVNSVTGGTLHIRSPAGFNMSLTIQPGTYANVSGMLYANYNVTLATFNTHNLVAPNGVATLTPKSAFLFRINGQIIQQPAFVNQTGAPSPVTFTVNHGANWTSYSYKNVTVNGTGYIGGSYGKQNAWVYNLTSGTMSDRSLDKAQMHVYELSSVSLATANNTVSTPVPVVTTVAPVTTVATTVVTTAAVVTNQSATTAAAASGDNTLLYVVAVIVVIIILALAWMMMKKSKK